MNENKKRNFFFIKYRHIKKLDIFPFHLFIYNPYNGNYTPFLRGNSPLPLPKRLFLESLLKKGAIIALDIHQRLTFFRYADLTEKERMAIQTNCDRILKKEATQSRKNKNEQLKEKNKPLNEIFNESVEKNDFLELIKKAQSEIMAFPETINETVSLSSFLAQYLLNDDNYHNRVIAFCYFLAIKSQKIDFYTLSELINSSFFCINGLSQINIAEVRPNAENILSRIKHIPLGQALTKNVNPHITPGSFFLLKKYTDSWHDQSQEKFGLIKTCELSQIITLSLLIFENDLNRQEQRKSISEILQYLMRRDNLARLKQYFSATIISAFIEICNDSIKQKDNTKNIAA